ncbi:MAG: TolC family protein [Gemmatimonadetes bacterium]|nr:TolC family protein [Gemmatimonadota bacterium]
MERYRFMVTALCALVLAVLPDAVPAAEWKPDGLRNSGQVFLSLETAIEQALEHNYDLLLAQERIEESRGSAFARLGALLPILSGTSTYRRLKTFQGEFGGGPVTSTPRDIWDSRASLTQSVFSLSLIQQWLAGRAGVEVADLDVEVAKRDTIATTALLYMEALRAGAAVGAGEANVKLGRALWKLTEGKEGAGAVTRIDVIRARIQLENERRRLLNARNELIRAKLRLIRAMGIPDGTPIVLTGKLELWEMEEATAEETVMAAFRNRTELQAQARRKKLAELALSSRMSERIPSVDVRADYGLIGEDAGDRIGSYSVGSFLTWPLYDGQREGRISESRSQLRQEEIRTKNLVHQIGVEARDAHQTNRLTREQAVVAELGLKLALEQLRLSRKAFSIGTLTHLEVITAQLGVASARDTAIEALFNFNAARVNLARAQGRMDKIYSGNRVLVEMPSPKGPAYRAMARSTRTR